MRGDTILVTEPPPSEDTIACLTAFAKKQGVKSPRLFWGKHKGYQAFAIDAIVWTDEGVPDWLLNPKEYVNGAWS